MDVKNLHTSKTVRSVLLGIGIAVVGLLIFQAGVSIGYRRASFSYGMGEHYYRLFSDRRGGMMMDFPRGELPGGHGAAGVIVRVSLPTFVVATKDNLEKTVIIATSTVIREFQVQATSSDLKVGDTVVVLGYPDKDAQIEASLIRIIPTQ